MLKLETERLILRTWSIDDIDDVHEYASNIENIGYMLWGPNTKEQSLQFIRQCIHDHEQIPITNYTFAVVYKSDNKVIGGGNITADNEFTSAEVGWLIHRDYWRQGLGTELAHELLRFGFEDLKLHRITATCDSENYGSYKVMENNDMRREAHTIKSRNARGEWRDEFHYAMLSDEWVK